MVCIGMAHKCDRQMERQTEQPLAIAFNNRVRRVLQIAESCWITKNLQYHLSGINAAVRTLVKKLQISCVGWLFSSSGVSATMICSCAVCEMMSSFCQHTYTHTLITFSISSASTCSGGTNHYQTPQLSIHYLHTVHPSFSPSPPSGNMWLHGVANCCKF